MQHGKACASMNVPLTSSLSIQLNMSRPAPPASSTLKDIPRPNILDPCFVLLLSAITVVIVLGWDGYKVYVNIGFFRLILTSVESYLPPAPVVKHTS